LQSRLPLGAVAPANGSTIPAGSVASAPEPAPVIPSVFCKPEIEDIGRFMSLISR
jgi:hypothetical protein